MIDKKPYTEYVEKAERSPFTIPLLCLVAVSCIISLILLWNKQQEIGATNWCVCDGCTRTENGRYLCCVEAGFLEDGECHVRYEEQGVDAVNFFNITTKKLETDREQPEED